MRLTDARIRSLPLPEQGQKTYFDESLKGFGCRVSQGGTRTFVVMVGRQRRLLTVGRYPTLSLADARAQAKVLFGAHVTIQASPRSAMTTQEALDVYYAAITGRLRPKTIYDYKRALDKHLAPLLKKKLADLSTDTLMRIVDGLHGTPIEQLHLFLYATTFFRFCVRRRFLTTHPLHGLQPPAKFHRRERVLTPTELTTVYRAAEAEPYPFGPIVLLCILTGQRRGEVGKLRAEYVNETEQLITLPKEITKNGLTHTFPYGERTKAVLQTLPKTGYLFPGRAYRKSTQSDPDRHFEGWSRGKLNFDKHCLVQNYTLHDLRRTFRTMQGQIGTAPHIAERLVNHISMQSDMQRIYDQYRYIPEMRTAVAEWDRYLEQLLAPS